MFCFDCIVIVYEFSVNNEPYFKEKGHSFAFIFTFIGEMAFSKGKIYGINLSVA